MGASAWPDGEQHLRAALAEFRELGLREATAFTWSALGFLLEKSGRDEDALAAYREGVTLAESLVHSLSKDVNGAVYRSKRQNREIYDRLIRLLIRKGRGAEALEHLERAKSKALVESLVAANIGASDPALANLFTRVRERQTTLREADRAVMAEAGKPDALRAPAKAEGLKRKLMEAQTAYLAAQEVRTADPDSAALVKVSTVAVEKLRRRLTAKTLLLEYYPDDNGLTIFAIMRDRPTVLYAVPAKKAELNRLVEAYRKALGDRTDVAGVAGKLYDALIAPAQPSMQGVQILVLVPAGELYDLPFQALGRPMPDGSFRYVLDDYAVDYLSSADQLNAATAPSRQPAISLLALGDPDGSLPGAHQELAALRKVFRRASIFTGGVGTPPSTV